MLIKIITKVFLSVLTVTLPYNMYAANLDDPTLEHGKEVYQITCATSYCHGINGAAAGAPRLAARDFNAGYIASITANGVPDTPMAGFANALSEDDMKDVLTYVASLNGIFNPDFSSSDALAGLGIASPNARRIPLEGAPLQGRELFFDTYEKGINRCSTCHEIEGIGIPVAAPITTIPVSISALRSLTTANVLTATLGDEAMPVLLLSRGISGSKLYDLSSVPPVQRTIQPNQLLEIEDGSSWNHANFIQTYNDEEIDLVLRFLRAITE